jgi:hypothetical protein
VSPEHLAELEHSLATTTAERDSFAHTCESLAHECDRLAHERDEYKSRADWLGKQLERLKYEARTPRERVDPRQIQLVFEPFAQALFGAAASSAEPGAEATGGEDGKGGRKKRKTTPHGRRLLPHHLPI